MELCHTTHRAVHSLTHATSFYRFEMCPSLTASTANIDCVLFLAFGSLDFSKSPRDMGLLAPSCRPSGTDTKLYLPRKGSSLSFWLSNLCKAKVAVLLLVFLACTCTSCTVHAYTPVTSLDTCSRHFALKSWAAGMLS